MKKKIIVLGASGMLGSVLCLYLRLNKYKVICISRKNVKYFSTKNFKNFLDLKFINFLEKERPTHVINCTGIINHRINKNYHETILINSLFPVFLTSLALKINFKLLHISTDCVFNGKKGNYNEKDLTDGDDLYAKSKILGEYLNKNTCIIRTSIIGPELNSKYGLLEWFLNSKIKVKGFKNVYFSGLTTLELSKIILKYFIITDKFYNKLIHVAGFKINKYELLKLINEIYHKKIHIEVCAKNKIDKSLDSSYFVSLTKYKKKSWIKLIKEMKTFNEKFF